MHLGGFAGSFRRAQGGPDSCDCGCSGVPFSGGRRAFKEGRDFAQFFAKFPLRGQALMCPFDRRCSAYFRVIGGRIGVGPGYPQARKGEGAALSRALDGQDSTLMDETKFGDRLRWYPRSQNRDLGHPVLFLVETGLKKARA